MKPAGIVTLDVVMPSMLWSTAPLFAMVPVIFVPATYAMEPVNNWSAVAVASVVVMYSAGMAATVTLDRTLPAVG